VADLITGDPGEIKAIVEGENLLVGLNRPDPMPEFTVKLFSKEIAAGETLHITISNSLDEVIETRDLVLGPDDSVIHEPVPLPAGEHQLSWTTSAGRFGGYELLVSQDVQINALTGKKL
jgi:hypothetical protein